MKKAFLIVFCALFFISSFFIVGRAVTRFSFPEPVADSYNKFLVTSDYVYQFSVLAHQDGYFNYNSSGSSISHATYPVWNMSCRFHDSILTVDFINYSNAVLTVYVWRFNSSGQIGYIGSGYQIPAGSDLSNGVLSQDFSFNYTGGVLGYGVEFANNVNNPQVSFSDTIDYSNQFVAMQSLLSSLNSSFGSQSDLIIQKLDAILVSDAASLQWFIDVFYDEAKGYWTFAKINFNGIISYLDSISKALGAGEDETATIADDMSGYNEMESARSSLQVTDAQGRPVDAAAQVEDAFSEAASGIGSLGSSVGSINSLMTDIISVHPLIIVPIIVALALGLIVTILGKNKSE